MRAVLSLLVLLMATLSLSAFLAYPLYQLTGDTFSLEFHKAVSRSLTLCGLFLSICLLAYNKLLNRESLGFAKTGQPARLFEGMVLGIFIVLLLEAMLLALQIHGFDDDSALNVTAIVKLLFKALVAGLLVGLIEETIFRGAIFSLLRKELGILATIIISSLFYAGVHFIKIPEYEGDTINWLSGFSLLPDAMDSLLYPHMVDLFITLFLLGVLLSYLRHRQGNIYLSIGVHAGIVMMVKIANYLTDYTEGSQYDFLVNRVNHQMGYLASVLIIIISCVAYARLSRKKPLQ